MTRRDSYHHGNLRPALLAAAETILREEGMRALSLREIAKRLGVSPTAVYRHFADKNALLAGIAAAGFARLNQAFDEMAAESDPPLHRLRRLGEAYVAFALAHGDLYRLMFGSHRPASIPELQMEGARAHGFLAETVRQCCGTGVDERQVAAATAAAWSLVHGYAMLRLDGHLDGMAPELLPDTGQVLANLLPQGASQSV